MLVVIASTSPGFSSERNEVVTFPKGVRVTLNHDRTSTDKHRPTHLVLYALPNGNTTLQSFGYRVAETPKPDHNVQHIGAQTRWLRERDPGTNVVVAYLECQGLGWPAWRRKNDPSGDRIAKITSELYARFPPESTSVTLTGHSGGGAYTFAFLDSRQTIPSWVHRIAFLDSNYGYKSEKHHGAILARWLRSSHRNVLSVLAYQDYLALDEGKPFVSKVHGTWGRSFAMLYDLSQSFRFRVDHKNLLQFHTALDGRVLFVLRENPTREIFHSPQVARNGFIHSLLTGTRQQNRGYAYFGKPVYAQHISPPPK